MSQAWLKAGMYGTITLGVLSLDCKLRAPAFVLLLLVLSDLWSLRNLCKDTVSVLAIPCNVSTHFKRNSWVQLEWHLSSLKQGTWSSLPSLTAALKPGRRPWKPKGAQLCSPSGNGSAKCINMSQNVRCSFHMLSHAFTCFHDDCFHYSCKWSGLRRKLRAEEMKQKERQKNRLLEICQVLDDDVAWPQRSGTVWLYWLVG